MFDSLLYFVEAILGSYPFLLTTTLVAFALKAYLLTALIVKNKFITTAKKSLVFIILVLIGSMIGDSAWILKLLHCLFFATTDYYQVRIFWIRIAWAFAAVQYQSLALFIESLVEQRAGFNIRQKIFLCISSCFFLFFMGLAFGHINCYQPSDRTVLECEMLKAFTLYSQFFLMLVTLFFVFLKVRFYKLPRILKKQFTLFIQGLIVPHLLSDFIQFYPFNFFPTYIASSYAVVSMSNIFLTCAIYFCSRKLMGLRFLNFQEHVQTTDTYSFIDDFKGVLEQLSHATTKQELGQITQLFFRDAFKMPLRRINLYIRAASGHENTPNQVELSKIENTSETFFNLPDPAIAAYMQRAKILIQDEIAFNCFYENNQANIAMLAFLEGVNADIVLPIFEKQKIIAYIIVERDSRGEFYSNMDRDEMLVFASYIGNIIDLMQHRNLETLMHQEKELKEELFTKHQEINQYRESIRSFLKHSKQKDIGIIFYKNRRFTFGNQTAKELIKININTQEGHPITQALKNIARHVEEYKTRQTCFTKDHAGNKLVIVGMPSLEYNNVILTLYYPEISDILANQTDLLKDPSKWDYLLYLETTKSGQLINQLIPGSGEQLLTFKINLLKIALSKKAILLTIPDDDLLPTVELLHYVSLRETLHVLTLQGPEKHFDTAIKLFNVNPILGLPASGQLPLLKKLDGNGTLLIQNIQFLNLETQEYLAEFIRFGMYRVFKSDQKVTANVRIICSTNQDLQTLVHEGKFSQNLFNELKKATLSMPSLLTLSDRELAALAEGFTEQVLQSSDTFKNFLELTEREKIKLAHQRPVSLQELKTKVQQLLIQKSRKNEIYQETQFDPAYDITDPDLTQAARLGKHALRDPKVMSLLWGKFKNQNKIATFLGVNRSSVNRRCKEYNLL